MYIALAIELKGVITIKDLGKVVSQSQTTSVTILFGTWHPFKQALKVLWKKGETPLLLHFTNWEMVTHLFVPISLVQIFYNVFEC